MPSHIDDESAQYLTGLLAGFLDTGASVLNCMDTGASVLNWIRARVFLIGYGRECSKLDTGASVLNWIRARVFLIGYGRESS